MKCPDLKSYVKNASTNDAREPQLVGNYRGTDLDRASMKRRQHSNKVLTGCR